MKTSRCHRALFSYPSGFILPPTEIITEARIFAISLLVLAGNVSLSLVSQIFGCSPTKHGRASVPLHFFSLVEACQQIIIHCNLYSSHSYILCGNNSYIKHCAAAIL